jgi:DNA-binding NtrC family response regulator
LRNILERAVLLGNQQLLTPKDLHFDMRVDTDGFDDGAIATLEEVEMTHIARALRILGGRVPETAKRLGIPRSSLYNKIKQYRMGHDAKTASSAAKSDTQVDAEIPERFADKTS